MLELQKKHHETRMERDKELYERQIKIVDAQIDRLVYDLYGLTEEEVKVVEKREDGSWRKSITEQRKNNKTNAINRSKNVGQAIYRVYVTGWKKRFKK
ncbi:hypothetical protein C4E24_08920 [ANME-1 cluster archaeon AG-394-G21]|nr:hypothetical protein [ANME-1 cluster archaeon AG-394-G21]